MLLIHGVFIIDFIELHNLFRLKKNLELVQFTSFGCGIDAITSDQSEEILRSKGRIHTLLKVDEGANLGAARIRLRSLLAAMKQRLKSNVPVQVKSSANPYVPYDESMHLKGYTILCPQCSPIHFRFLEAAYQSMGNKFIVMPRVDANAIDQGLKYVNNDACFPSIITIGQMIAALKSGKYDINKTALIITQTCGACRMAEYIPLIRKAVHEMGWGHIPVIPYTTLNRESHPGFQGSFHGLHRALQGMVLGDTLMKCLYRTRPYEKVPGSADELYRHFDELGRKQCSTDSFITFNRLIKEVVREFDNLPLNPNIRKPRIGVLGEIFVKLHPYANNDIVKLIEKEGGEATVTDIYNTLVFCIDNDRTLYEDMAAPFSTYLKAHAGVFYAELYRKSMHSALTKSKRFLPTPSIYQLRKLLNGILQTGNTAGEGWLLPAEMVELIHSGINNIAIVQPFACMPNHVTGKGMIKELRKRNPGSNIIAIDYDSGASEVNQLNRLKLLMSNAEVGSHPDETKLRIKK